MPGLWPARRILLALILALAGVGTAAAQTWAPPVGVPNPPFGITQVAGPYTHYVDNTHSASTDTSNPNGSPAKPRKTIPSTLSAGAVVEVHGGPYSYSSAPRWTTSGTSSSPVFIRGVGNPVINGGGSLRDLGVSGSYAVVEGFVFDGMQVGLVGSYMALRSSEVKNYSPSSNSAAITGSGTNLVFYNNHIHHNGNASGTAEVDVHAVKFGTGSSSIWVVDNLIHENGGDEIQLGDANGSEPWVHHVYFGRNTGYGSRENCVDIKRARDIIVSQNDCSGYRPVSSSSGEAIVVHNAPERVWILNNKIHDSALGVVTSSNGSSPIYVVGNLFYRLQHSAGASYDPANLYAGGHAIQSWTTGEIHIVNNTIHDVDAGIAYAGGDASTVHIVNNVIGRLLQTTHHVAIATSGAATKSTISNTLMQAPSRIKWGTTSTVRTVAALKSAFPSQCGGCTDADPQFANAAAYDLRPGPASPLLDSAVVDPVYDTFRNLYGISIARDFTGASRPQGYTWDMGAYEGAGDPAPDPVLLSVGDVAVTEGNSGTATATFTVTLSAASTQTVTVSYATANGTATAGSDYTAASGSLSFSPGATSRTVAVSVTGDTAPEGDEDFLLNLSSPTNATLGDGQGRATIQNDDTVASTLSIADASTSEGNSATKSLVFTVTLSPASSQTVTVSYATANGTATAGSDYVAATGSLSFTAGQTSKTVSVTVNGDTTVEPNETFLVNLSSPSGATLADGQAQGTITNDDTAPLPTLSINDVSVAEGNSGTAVASFTVTLSASSSSTVTVAFATANGTATAGSDYVAQTGNLSFTAGQTTKAISVTVNGDTTVEPNETFVVNLSSPSGATLADAQGQATITNDDSAPLPTLAINDASLAEGNSGTTVATFTVTLSAASSSTVTVAFATANGTATAGSDYVAATGSLSFTAGQTTKTISVTVNGDTTVEPNETFSVSLSSPSGATLADAQGQATITNDDTAPPPSGTTPVVWTSPVGVTVSGNSLTKSAATAWTNSGAVSTHQLASGDGYVEFTASETNTYRMLGLGSDSSSCNYQEIDFAIELVGNGQIAVFENGTQKAAGGAYASGDKLRVAIVGGQVKYSRNGVVFHTSTQTPSYPLLVDTSLYNSGSTLNSAVVSGFSAASPPPPSTGDAVIWTSAVGVTVSGNSLTKTAATAWTNASAVSTQQLASGDGYVEFTASETNTYRMLGLSNGSSSSSYQEIDFAIELVGNGQIAVFENGTQKAAGGAYASGDKLRVAIVGGQVKYSRNGVVFYTSTQTPTYPLFVDTSLYDSGATLGPVIVSGFSSSAPPSTAIPVAWTSAVGLTVSANSLTKTAATAWTNASAVSTQRIATGDGYVEFAASETNTYRMLGLSNDSSSSSYQEIDFAIELVGNGQIAVFENGTQKAAGGAYASGDKLRVAVVSGQVRYSRNGTIFYTSTQSPIYPLLVDTSLYNTGSTLNSVVISGN